MKQEHSYGALLYFIAEGVRYFVLIGAIRDSGRVEYGFPKGHPDPEDKSILDTILREIQEETGISHSDIILDTYNEKKPAFSLSYEITRKGEQLLKTSTYYAIEMKKRDIQTRLEVPSDFIHEIKDIRIVAENEIDKVLSHENEKKLLRGWINDQE